MSTSGTFTKARIVEALVETNGYTQQKAFETGEILEEFGQDAYRPASPNGVHHWKVPIMVPAKSDEVDPYLKRMGGRQRNIAVKEINNQPGSSVVDYLKRQIQA